MSTTENELKVQIKKISIHKKYRENLSNVEVRRLENGFISDTLSQKLASFNRYRAIIISTQPGSGKTTFSEKTIADFASATQKGKVLVISNRIAQDIAIKKRTARSLGIYKDFNDAAIHEMTDFGNITFMTYQQLKIKIRKASITGNDFAFAIFDEAHYFTSDATFSKDNGWLLTQLPKVFSNTIRIYITATVKEVLPYICKSELNPFAKYRWEQRWYTDNYYNNIYNHIAVPSEQEQDELLSDRHFAYYVPTPILYEQIPDFSHIKLKFYSDNEEIESVLKNTKDKAIIFVDTKERGQELHELFADSEYMDADTKTKNPEFIGELVNKEAFDKQFLITTSVFENGCNIKDNTVKTVIIDSINPVSIVQMAGRRRKCYPTDTFTLYLKIPSLEYLRQLRYSAQEKLRLILESEENPTEFMRELLTPGVNNMIGNIISVNEKGYTFDWLTKDVLQDDIDLYTELIECMSESGIQGYCSKIAKECFCKELSDSMLPESKINTQELSTWLESYISKPLSQDECDKFIAEFKVKYTKVFVNSNSDNRGKARQAVGHTWFNRRIKNINPFYELAQLSGKKYILLKLETEKAAN